MRHLRAQACQVEVVLDEVLFDLGEKLVALERAKPTYPRGFVEVRRPRVLRSPRPPPRALDERRRRARADDDAASFGGDGSSALAVRGMGLCSASCAESSSGRDTRARSRWSDEFATPRRTKVISKSIGASCSSASGTRRNLDCAGLRSAELRREPPGSARPARVSWRRTRSRGHRDRCSRRTRRPSFPAPSGRRGAAARHHRRGARAAVLGGHVRAGRVGRRARQTEVQRSSAAPVWDHLFTLRADFKPGVREELVATLWHEDVYEDQLVGQATVDLTDVLHERVTLEVWVPLLDERRLRRTGAELLLRVQNGKAPPLVQVCADENVTIEGSSGRSCRTRRSATSARWPTRAPGGSASTCSSRTSWRPTRCSRCSSRRTPSRRGSPTATAIWRCTTCASGTP